ncbi:MAG: hypothetical protein JWO08_4245 [Verrucomicrobiaceae bacterium]|nr:hypothetical protein [Verrucomicrobiaceae bacterium]
MRTALLAFLCLTAPAFAQPVSLFDGKTMEGWESRSPELWKVEDGCLTGGDGSKIPHNDFLCTTKSFSNFTLKLKIKLTGDPATGLINSGVQIRTQRNPTGHEVCGYQCDYGEPNWYAGIYDEGRRNKFIAPADMAIVHPALKLWDWNEYTIKAEGNRIQTWINGVPGVDYKELDPNIPYDGIIGVQVHSGGNTKVQLKDITIDELPATKDAPTWEKLGGVEGVKKLINANKPKDSAAAPTTKRDISYNDIKGTPLTAEEELKKFHLPEGYEIELVVKESDGIGKFVSVYFDQRGRLWTQTALEYPLDGNENPAAAEAVYAAKSKDKVLVYSRESVNAPLPPGGITNPTVFADGLTIPLGLLPWGNGDSAYILHGHDVLLYKDTDGDGKADKSEVVLTGFGVQDSHLFPHQFTRAPGGWIWMAQGAFNNGTVLDKSGKLTEVPSTRMARFRPDGTGFEITSQGPCNIWGLVMTGEGETFIQEANDFGYPVMPFHEYANYPGCADRLFKSYAPHFPVQEPDFKMGGTGLSGLALGEGEFRKVASALAESGKGPDGVSKPNSTKVETTLKPDDLCMFIANPIISKVQTLAMHREDSRKFPREAPNGWRLEQAQDLITSDDPFFRPVGMTQGPDGCLYIVDWYNKIISHNEVARNHPDRDKIRGRIWRVKPKAAKHVDVPDFTKLETDELIALLGTQPTAQAHIAWQTVADRKDEPISQTVSEVADNGHAPTPSRIQFLWILSERDDNDPGSYGHLFKAGLSNLSVAEIVGTEAAHPGNRSVLGVWTLNGALHNYTFTGQTSDPSVRRATVGALGRLLGDSSSALSASERDQCMRLLLSFANPSLSGPLAPSRNGKLIPAGEAYDREFERYLVRMFLEQHPEVVAKFLDTPEAANLPIEARVLASLALEPKTSASRVAKLLPQLDRAPNDEELLRLAQFPEEAGCGDALKVLLSNAKSCASVAEKLLAQKTKLDPAKIAPLLNEAAKALLGGKDDERTLGVGLIGGFQLASLEDDLVAMAKQNTGVLAALQALRELRSGAVEVFASLAKSADPSIRDEALAALASSKSPKAAEEVFTLYPSLTLPQQRAAMNALSSSKSGALAMVTALTANKLPKTDLDGPMAERLNIVLGDNKDLAALMQSMGNIFHPVLYLDGKDTAWADSKITLDGPFTVEAWVRLAPGINNGDSLLGSPGVLDMNFFGSTFRVYGGSTLKDVVVAKKPMTPDLWTHLAVTRNAQGICRIYQNGELDATANKPAPAKLENCKVGWSGPAKGTEGSIAEFRVWNRERNVQEIRSVFDRSFEGQTKPDGLVFYNAGGNDNWGKLGEGARIAKTTDYPPVLTKEQADKLDTQFAKYSALGHKKGNLEMGKALSAICMACHTINGAGGQIGPNLSGAGAMGLEGVLRNIMTPNAAMEAGYRIFRTELKSGDIVDAFYVGEDKEAFIIRQPGLPDRRVPKKDVRTTRYIRRSLMPEGLLDALNDEQVTDLMSYLMTLK